ncbi:MAG: YkgJ family cysteine cluster protein [Bacteroidetes bacterium]|nr:YkgJ family cysteine cluster protein [Bacteroidota bacterium]
MEINLSKIADAARFQQQELQILLKKVIAANAKEFDQIILPIAKDISTAIDCRLCANCCKVLEAGISPDELIKLAHLKGLSQEDFTNSEVSTEDNTKIQFLSKKPCIFLSCNLCTIYTSRPNACISFPDLERPLVKYRIRKIIAHYGICPIVFHTVEKLKLHYAVEKQKRN